MLIPILAAAAIIWIIIASHSKTAIIITALVTLAITTAIIPTIPL